MLVLGIESSCDETCCAIVRDGREILSNIVASQAELHEAFGGVVPELACRQHIDLIIPVIDKAIKEANITLNDIDLISVANCPGLIGALLIGINAAKTLALALNKPFIGVNHIEAHLYAAMMSHPEPIKFPCLGVVLSGGHTSLLIIKGIGDYELLGETVDDAIGEAFDKVAKLMGLPYPGGPLIEQLALKGDPHSYTLKSGTVKNNPLAFSFSGLKTGVLYNLKGQNSGSSEVEAISLSVKQNMAASFQRVAFTDVINKTTIAAKEHNCEMIIFGGGVTNNQALRQMFQKALPKSTLLWPSKGLSLDNAAMVAGLAYHQFLAKGGCDGYDLEGASRSNF